MSFLSAASKWSMPRHWPAGSAEYRRSAPCRQERSKVGLWYGWSRWRTRGQGSVAGFNGSVWKRADCSGFACVSLPALRAKVLLRHEPHLIVHLPRAVDPVAEIDMGQSHRLGARDVVEDHERAERAVGQFGIEVGIDHGEAVGHLVRQRDRHQLALAPA